MTFEERIVPPLTRLSHKLLDAGLFGYLENVANFMVAITSGRWSQLPDDEQLMWLDRLSGLLGARGLMDSWDMTDPDLSECHTILDGQIRALKKRN
jgi:hypothetical protein